jgi:hypothetical protein
VLGIQKFLQCMNISYLNSLPPSFSFILLPHIIILLNSSYSLFLCFGWFFFLQYWGLNSGPSFWATPPALILFYCDGFFRDRVLWTICLGWLWTEIFLSSSLWVARNTSVTHQFLALFFYYFVQKTNHLLLLMKSHLIWFCY